MKNSTVDLALYEAIKAFRENPCAQTQKAVEKAMVAFRWANVTDAVKKGAKL